MRIFLSFLVIFNLAGIPAVWAYGKTGHRVVGEIASRHLTATARKRIGQILGSESLAEASTWADEMKSNPDEYWRKANVYHYLNVPPGRTFENSPRNPAGDALSAYNNFVAILKSAKSSRVEKAFALKFLVHIIGDMHEPMHFGHARDRGGNDIKVIWFGKKTNLHKVWDSLLINHEKLSFTELANFIDRATPQQIAIDQRATPIDWIDEGLRLNRKIYHVGDGNFSWAYVYKYRPVVNRELLKGGLSLAGVLNRIFTR
ncbi:MAG: S1/P1 nuclease [Alphaproteobacteria bacterium]|nr:S1/P1 nuclease [Alphaproteobacteria bacterium]